MRPSTSFSTRQGTACPSSLPQASRPGLPARRRTVASLSASAARPAALAARPVVAAPLRANASTRRSGRGRLQTVSVFTGIVQGKAAIAAVDRRAAGAVTLRITFPPGTLEGVTIGASVAINGTCLTVVTTAADTATFDVIDETLRLTNLGGLKEGDAVNFERAARVGDEIGGHLVSGHVACLAALTSVEPSPDGNVTLRFAAPGRWGRYLLPKGFVALDGVSLTLGADVVQDGDASAATPTTTFAVHLIPETLRATTLGGLSAGAALNLEVDAGTQAVVDAVEAAVEARLEARLEAALARRGL